MLNLGWLVGWYYINRPTHRYSVDDEHGGEHTPAGRPGDTLTHLESPGLAAALMQVRRRGDSASGLAVLARGTLCIVNLFLLFPRAQTAPNARRRV